MKIDNNHAQNAALTKAQKRLLKYNVPIVLFPERDYRDCLELLKYFVCIIFWKDIPNLMSYLVYIHGLNT